MAKKIVYFLGAGASFNSVPIVSFIHERLEIFIEFMKHTAREKEDIQYEVNSEARLSQIWRPYYELLEEIRFFGTPDTLARKFFLAANTGDNFEKLDRLKNLLTSFFIFEQFERDSAATNTFISIMSHLQIQKGATMFQSELDDTLDKRYLSFLATVLNRDKKYNIEPPPNNLSIISWNYDMQVEYALQEISGVELHPAQNFLKVHPGLLTNWEFDMNKFCLVKLNGTANFYKREPGFKPLDPKYTQFDNDMVKIIMDQLFKERTDYLNLLHFAWEDDNRDIVNSRTYARELIKNADVIVVIGYSFPDFNRLIDKVIFADAKEGVPIYLQDPNAKDIVQKLEGVKSGLSQRAFQISQTQNFQIPFEFWERTD